MLSGLSERPDGSGNFLSAPIAFLALAWQVPLVPCLEKVKGKLMNNYLKGKSKSREKRGVEEGNVFWFLFRLHKATRTSRRCLRMTS